MGDSYLVTGKAVWETRLELLGDTPFDDTRMVAEAFKGCIPSGWHFIEGTYNYYNYYYNNNHHHHHYYYHYYHNMFKA